MTGCGHISQPISENVDYMAWNCIAGILNGIGS